jgi:hypothetical protein
MDDYYEETPEEREAGRKLLRDLTALTEKLLKTKSREEAEAILAEYEKEQSNDTTK